MSTPVSQWLPGMPVTAGRLQYMLEMALSGGSVINVASYGTVGDGSADDSAAIQAALNLARDRGGAQVLVPPGTYLIGQTLRIYSNTRLTLRDGAEFRRNVAGTMLINGDASQSLGGYTGQSRIVLEGGLWNMRGTTTGLTASAMCISIGHATDIVIRDLEVRDLPGYHAIELNSTSHGVIQNCKFRGYIDPGSRDFSEAIQIDLAKSVAVFGGFGPYDHTPCEDVLISGNHFGASGTAGTTAWPRGIGSHSATIGKWHRRIRIANNSFEGLLQYAISAYSWEDVTITGNTFVSCGSGVRLRTVIASDPEDTKDATGTPTGGSQNMRNLTIAGNSMRNGQAYDNPVVAYGETTGTILNLSITGNTIDGTTGGQSGVRLYNVSRATLGDNVIANTSGTSISMENVNNTVVSSNVVWTPGGRGITCVGGTNSSIVGNQVRDSANEGILLQTSSDIQVRNNFVKGASTASNGGYSGIRLSSSQTRIVITGNRVQPDSTNANRMSYGLSIDGTNTNISRWGNDLRALGGTYANGSLADTSGSSTVATDLT